MATELAKAYVQIIPSARGIKGSITQALGGEAASAGTNAGQSFGSNLVSKVLGVVSVAAIGKALASTITEGGALEQSIGGVETLFKESADTVKANAAEAYRTAGMSANQYMEQTTSFTASLLQSLGGDTAAAADMADMAMRDMSDNSNKMGTDMERITDAYQGFAKQNYTMLDNLKLGYGGTKTEMERLLQDAQKITGIKYDINSLADVYSAIHVIQGELDITGTTAQEAATTLSGSFHAMAAAGKNVLGNLTLGKDITPSLQALAKTTTTFLVGNLLPAVWNILKALPGGMVTLVQEMGNQLEAQLPSFLAQFRTGMKTNLSQLIAAGQAMLSGLIAGLMQNLPRLLQSGVSLINSLVTGIYTALPQILSAAFSLMTQFGQGIIANLPQILAAGTSILLNVVNGIGQAMPQILTSAAKMVATLISGLLQNLPQIISAGFSLITALIQGIGQALPGIITAGGQAAQTLWTAFTSLNWPQLGADILHGIIDGIKSAIGALVEAAVSAAQAAFNAVKNALDTKLQTVQHSLRCRYDYQANTITAEVWQGLDRTQEQMENPFVTFSDGFGNLTEVNASRDTSNYKNYAVVVGQDQAENRKVAYADLSGGGYKRMLYVDARSERWDQEKQTEAEYLAGLEQLGLDKLLDYMVITNVDIQAASSGFVYRQDWDLGDQVDAIVEDVGLAMQARIVTVREVIKQNNHTIEIELGDKKLTQLRKARLIY